MARSPGLRSVVLGVDGSASARRAAQFLARLAPAPRGTVTAVTVVEAMRLPSLGLLPAGVRVQIAAEARRQEAVTRARALRTVEAAARPAARAGWRVRASVRSGVPLTELLAAVDETAADLLVLGARGVGGLDRLLLGSVAEAALRRSPVPVLIVK
jgi:nucleotide-binding universal stress UspA family protein